MNWKRPYALGVAASMVGVALLIVGSGGDWDGVVAIAWAVLTLGFITGLIAGTVLYATGHWTDDDLWLHMQTTRVFPRFWAHLGGGGHGQDTRNP